MTPKERIDKRATEMNKAIIKKMRELESELSLHQIWILIAREHGTQEADKRTTKNLQWKP